MPDLEKLLPTFPVVKVGGKEITIRTMKVKQLAAVLKAAAPFMGLLKSKPGSEDLLGLVAGNLPGAVTMVAVLTDQSEDWVGDLDVAELVELFSGLLEVNLDFFTQRVLPLLSDAMAKVAKSPTPSPAKPRGPMASST